MSKQSVSQIVTEGAHCRIVYRDCQGEITERCVTVDRIWSARNGATCVFGLCHRRGQTRTFDMARILAAMPDESTQITTFAMSHAVSCGDTEAFSTAYAALHYGV